MSGPSVDVVWDPQAQMNSLDCWDYSIELSCLQGPEGIRDLSFERRRFGALENVRIYERSPVISFLFSSTRFRCIFEQVSTNLCKDTIANFLLLLFPNCKRVNNM